MTVMAERTVQTPQMSVEEFERIAAFAAKETDDAVRLEFINGRIGVKKVADGDHNSVIVWLGKRCMRARPDLDLYQGQGLRVEKYREGRARPDAVLVPEDHFAGHGEWADPSGVLLVLEVTSYDSDTDRRDRQEKPVAYGAAGIPFYLLIDRNACTVKLYSDPDPGVGYRDSRTVPFGVQLLLPQPLDIELDTEKLKQYVD
ncbi:Uma2 family endonuclease [Streptomyces canus]|uniref:Uma2 family endonuclease n=1 Tax=Streptomyces TaxID=1883 RepID=UPI003243C7E0|nr:Uma2 family endonuclease [Streptomyces canus]WSZ32707.1 Uma2 family endonuclease [Streptomyces sp. NBC_00882]WSZ59656.1 Uma2 family endonuclease [Streptomyces canus]